MLRSIRIKDDGKKTLNQHGIHAILACYSEGKISTDDALYALDLKNFLELETLMLNHYVPTSEPSEEEVSEQIRAIFGKAYKTKETA